MEYIDSYYIRFSFMVDFSVDGKVQTKILVGALTAHRAHKITLYRETNPKFDIHSKVNYF